MKAVVGWEWGLLDVINTGTLEVWQQVQGNVCLRKTMDAASVPNWDIYLWFNVIKMTKQATAKIYCSGYYVISG